jgi:hypothetical protein
MIRGSGESRLLAELGTLIGDFPLNYVRIFRELGYEPEVEVLGLDGIYQFVSVRKAGC